MSFASWLSAPLLHFAPRLNKESGRQPSRWPTRSRPSLEHLEERRLLDASSGTIAGAPILASNFAPIAIGLALPTGSNVPSTTGVTTQTFPTAGSEAALAASSSFAAQDQLSSQFHDFAVNSQGDNYLLPQLTSDILLIAYGFGSGTQPNAPWMPAAYNVGLGNHQFNYSSQSDFGFSPTPPWFHPTAQSLSDEQTVIAEVDSADLSESPPVPQSLKDRGQDESQWLAEDAHEQNTEQLAPKEQSDHEEAVPDAVRGDPALDDPLFTEPVHTLAAAARADQRDHAAFRLSNTKHSLADTENKGGEPASQEQSIHAPLWLSALAPAQMAALVASLPGVSSPATGGEMSISSAVPE